MSDEVVVDRDGRVLIARLNRPRVRNALDTALLQVLDAVLTDAAKNPEVAVLMLGSTDPAAFSAGMDTTESRTPGARTLDVLLEVQWGLESFAKPVVAGLDGFVIGGGAELALSADVRIGSPSTVFRFPGTGYGLVQGSWHLVDAVGVSWARQLVLTGRAVAAGECVQLGLLHELHEDPDAAAVAAAHALAARSDVAMRESKRLILESSTKSLRQRFDDERAANQELVGREDVARRMSRPRI